MKRLLIVSSAIAEIVLLVGLAYAQSPDDIYWDNSMSLSIPGLNGEVKAMTVYNGILIVGGSFTVAGSKAINNIATWDGNDWWPLGSGMVGAYFPAVSALTMYDGKLIAGGFFDSAGGISANNIAAWDGSSWSPLGLGVDGSVLTLATYDGKLIAGGDFAAAGGIPADEIASWDGSNWSSLGAGSGADDFYVSALTVYDSKLIVGRTVTALGDTTSCIVSWDGSSWSALGSGLDHPYRPAVKALTVYNGQLIVGGNFGSAGSDSARGIAAWDGSSWLPLGEVYVPTPIGEDAGSVYALTIYNGRLIAGANWEAVDLGGGWSVSEWTGTNWSALASGGWDWYGGHWTSVSALMAYDSMLIIGGHIEEVGEVAVKNIASWDGASWAPLEAGNGGVVRSLTTFEGALIVGGEFATAGGLIANNIVAWDAHGIYNNGWSSMGSGVNGVVTCMTVYDGKLIAGGQFDTAGGVAASHIAAWNGSGWSPIGSGVNGEVSALAVYNGNLVVGGKFTLAGGTSVANIASWDGSNWSALGSGRQYSVVALTIYENKLIVGSNSVNETERLASWDGSSWVDFNPSYPNGYNARVLAVHDNVLLVGKSGVGCGSDCSGQAYVSSWDGANWTWLFWGAGGDWGVFSSINALTTYDNKLIVGGTLDVMWREWGGGTVEVDNILSWDGNSISPLGSGVARLEYLPPPYEPPPVRVFALTEYDGKLIVGGNFTHAGGKVSVGLAAWTKRCCNGTVGNVDETGAVDLMDLTALVSYLTGKWRFLPCSSAANVNARGIVDLADLSALVSYLTGGGYVLPNCL